MRSITFGNLGVVGISVSSFLRLWGMHTVSHLEQKNYYSEERRIEMCFNEERAVSKRVNDKGSACSFRKRFTLCSSARLFSKMTRTWEYINNSLQLPSLIWNSGFPEANYTELERNKEKKEYCMKYEERRQLSWQVFHWRYPITFVKEILLLSTPSHANSRFF
jgi:hypothetical protein